MSGYVVVQNPLADVVLDNGQMWTGIVNCPAGTSVLSGYHYWQNGQTEQPFPSTVTSTGYPSGPGQWTVHLQRTQFGTFTGKARIGAICAAAS